MKAKTPKKLLVPIKKTGGRSNTGRISVRHKGGGVKRMYRIVSFGQLFLRVPGKVLRIDYDPNRSAGIALIDYENGKKGYIIAPKELKEGDAVLVDDKTKLKPGNRMRIKNIPVGTPVHNISIHPDGEGKIARSAGSSALVLAHEDRYTNLRMPSREVRKVLSECFASVGELSNQEHRYRKIGKAGTARKMGRRPTVRGSAMNPCDHAHGGGEGRAPIGMPAPKTPWGKIARGVKTRRRKHTDRYIIKRAVKKKKK